MGEQDSGLFVNILSIKKKWHAFSGLSLRSKLDAFLSVSLSAQLWAGTLGEIIVMSSAKPLTV